MLDNVIKFSVEDFCVFEEKKDSQFVTARIDAFSTGKSRNNTTCDLEALKRTAETIYEKPVIFEVDKVLDDFGSHHEGFTIPAGFVVPGSLEFKEQPDGRTTLSVFAKIWRKYSGKFLDIFKQYNQTRKNVSVEVELIDSEKDKDDLLVMKDWAYAAICVLGDFVTPASPSAKIELMSFAKQEKEEYEKAYFSEFGRYDSIDFRIPKSIKENAQNGLDLYKQYGGGNSVSLSMARQLIKNEVISPQKVRYISKYFSKHVGNDPEDKFSSEFVSFQLHGGSHGRSWSTKLSKQIKEMDDKHMSYFETLTFPYDSLKDINPALKGIDPPITLGQANQIAKVADSIGSDEKKNGWAIAISQFKKTHVVKDGKWVEKKNMSEEEQMGDEEEVKDKPKEEIPEKEEMAKEEETPKKEEPEKKEEEKKEEFSNDANLDVAAILAMLEDETEDYRSIVEAEFAKPDGEKDFAKICQCMYSKMCKMKAYMAKRDEEVEKAKKESEEKSEEFENLKEFKSKIEKQEFDFAVTSFIEEVRGDIPKENLESLIEQSKNYSLDNLETWKNAVRSMAYTFSKSSKENSGINKYGLPFGDKKEDKKVSVWERI